MAVSRRELLKLSGIGTAGVAAAGLGGLGFDLAFARDRAYKYKLDGVTTTASICPYCAVGCGTLVHSRDGRIINIEGNADSPISTGSLCPKGSAIFQLAVNPNRVTKTVVRKPNSTKWEEIDREQALDRVAELLAKTRDESFVEVADDRFPAAIRGKRINQATGVFVLGGATNDNEENFLAQKLFHSLGVVRLENQARI